MLTANLWTEGGLVNGSLGTIQDILFGDQGPPSFPITVFITFDDYKGPIIINIEGIKVIPIAPIRRTWESKTGTSCSRLQVPLRLAWALTVHKNQKLTLPKAFIDLGTKKFTAGLSFVAISRVRIRIVGIKNRGRRNCGSTPVSPTDFSPPRDISNFAEFNWTIRIRIVGIKNRGRRNCGSTPVSPTDFSPPRDISNFAEFNWTISWRVIRNISRVVSTG
ncbi:hypothetical protein Glove_147g6 [Diversispora epigaea]|uniref:ATP-dependent DNA helicase n=1 Tax=Diversispora epigaea TaxID=1348612 RepID=A0A397ITR2_9GLOM|nr:hypothetical protein Glove_147g6 [Diversispora epigaea]